MPALYLADTVQTATAEWYRALAEWGLSPEDHVPYDHHRWRLDLQLTDLSDIERLHGVALDAPKPSRHTGAGRQGCLRRDVGSSRVGRWRETIQGGDDDPSRGLDAASIESNDSGLKEHQWRR